MSTGKREGEGGDYSVERRRVQDREKVSEVTIVWRGGEYRTERR